MCTDIPPSRSSSPTEEIAVRINGEEISAEVEPRLKLSDFLRRRGYHGVRVGCEHGVCGACTVLMNGKTTKSCLTYAVQADDRAITTVEGLSNLTDDGDSGLHPIQRAFHEEHALQCGFCTSGFVMATAELLSDNADPDHDEIEQGLADNICRCTGYQNIYDAVKRAADYSEDSLEMDGDDT
ncbi:MAG: (2Fe-2S)-binding protein [Halobacteriaceae archaeon]